MVQVREGDMEIDEALGKINELKEAIEEHSTGGKEGTYDFLDSVEDTLISMQERGRDYATQGQQDKIEEIESELQDMEWM